RQWLGSDGTDGGGNDGCEPATALNRADAVAVSPDGMTVAVAASGAGSITFFSRDVTSGKLTELQCLQQNVPLGGACRAAPALDGVSAVAFAPDGRDLIALTTPHDQVVDVHRSDDGTLSTSCVSRSGTSGSGARNSRVDGRNSVAISADGRQVYVRTIVGVVWLTRDPETGALKTAGCVNPAGGSGVCSAAPGATYSPQLAYGAAVTAG